MISVFSAFVPTVITYVFIVSSLFSETVIRSSGLVADFYHPLNTTETEVNAGHMSHLAREMI